MRVSLGVPQKFLKCNWFLWPN